jgi:hypothetical protein
MSEQLALLRIRADLCAIDRNEGKRAPFGIESALNTCEQPSGLLGRDAPFVESWLLQDNTTAYDKRRWQLRPGPRERTPQGPRECGLKSLLGKKIVERRTFQSDWKPQSCRCPIVHLSTSRAPGAARG